VKNFLELLGTDTHKLLQGVKLAAIGPITAATLTDSGLTPTVVAEEFTIDGVVSAIVGRL
jgi:uroporphyrinogen III methyltransferase/synthase